MHRKFCYIYKHNKLVQLVVQVKYHVNVIYSLGVGTYTHTHTRTHANIPTSWTKAISRNQAHAWFKNIAQMLFYTKAMVGYIIPHKRETYNCNDAVRAHNREISQLQSIPH